jgi:hypothetical protein
MARRGTHVSKGTSFYKGMIRSDPCVFCGYTGATPRTVDHIRPRSRNGSNAWFNFAGACQRCNNRKKNNSLLGHLLGVDLPNSNLQVQPPSIEDRWYDPLQLMPYGPHTSITLD